MSTEAPAQPPATEPKPGEPAKTPTPTPTPPAADTGGEGSPEAIRRDLVAERSRRQKLEKDLEDLQAKHATDEEKALNGARSEGEKAGIAKMLDRIVRSEVRSAAAGKFADPADAIVHLGDLKQFVGKDDEVDDKAIGTALDALLKEKPYLAARGGKAAPLPGGGTGTPPSGDNFNDTLRRKMRGQR